MGYLLQAPTYYITNQDDMVLIPKFEDELREQGCIIDWHIWKREEMPDRYIKLFLKIT